MSDSPNDARATSLLRPGDRVDGRYRIEEVLGGGGMATVYRAKHEALDRPVALKVIAQEVRALPGIAERFLSEARAATRLRGEHVVRVFDVGTASDGTPYLAMELLEGRDLDAVLATSGPLPTATAVDYVLQTCEALAEVHGSGIVHRDLKPANLFLARGPDGLPCVKLIDFGVARIDSALNAPRANWTSPSGVVGSPRYMAPEQMESATNADARSDIWAMGVVLYELLTGEAAYDGESYWDLYIATMEGPPTRPSALRRDLPRALDAVVLRCLRAEPRERWADVAELAAALVPFGEAGAAERAARVARVLRAARAGSRGGVPFVELAAPLGSRVQRKVAARTAKREARMELVTWVALAAVAVAATVVGSRAFFRPHVAAAAPAPAATTPTVSAATAPTVRPAVTATVPPPLVTAAPATPRPATRATRPHRRPPAESAAPEPPFTGSVHPEAPVAPSQPSPDELFEDRR